MSKLINISQNTAVDLRLHLSGFIADESNLYPDQVEGITEESAIALLDSISSEGGLWTVAEEHTELATTIAEKVLQLYIDTPKEELNDEIKRLIVATARVVNKLTS